MGTGHRWSGSGVADMRLRYDTHGWLMLACELECRATLLGIPGYTQRNVMRLDTHN